MTRDDIIRMAREAGFGEFADMVPETLERFATLVEATEAAKWAKGAKISIPTELMEQQFSVYHRRGYEAGKALIPAAIAAEREACAKECEKQIKTFLSTSYATNQPMSSFKERFACTTCAAFIRARSEK